MHLPAPATRRLIRPLALFLVASLAAYGIGIATLVYGYGVPVQRWGVILLAAVGQWAVFAGTQVIAAALKIEFASWAAGGRGESETRPIVLTAAFLQRVADPAVREQLRQAVADAARLRTAETTGIEQTRRRAVDIPSQRRMSP